MNPCHRVSFTHGHRENYKLVAGFMPQRDHVWLPMGGAFVQGFSNKCGAASVVNTLETCDSWLDEVVPSVDEVYALAREIGEAKPHHQGSIHEDCAEAACRLMEGAAKWMLLPLEPEVLENLLTVERTAISYAMDWTSGHMTSRVFANDILFPNRESVAPGHAVTINGWEASRSYRTGLFWTKRKSVPVFSIENTHLHASRRFYIQTSEVPVFGRSAIVFVPPEYT